VKLSPEMSLEPVFLKVIVTATVSGVEFLSPLSEMISFPVVGAVVVVVGPPGHGSAVAANVPVDSVPS